jgi:hypothetical protein
MEYTDKQKDIINGMSLGIKHKIGEDYYDILLGTTRWSRMDIADCNEIVGLVMNIFNPKDYSLLKGHVKELQAILQKYARPCHDCGKNGYFIGSACTKCNQANSGGGSRSFEVLKNGYYKP